MPRTNSYRIASHKYIFSGTTNVGPFSIRPYRWAVSIHEGVAPTDVDSTWFTDVAKRKSAKYITSWTPISGDYNNGVQNTDVIEFDHVPTGQTWVITHYIVWAVANNNGTDVLSPLLIIPFGTEETVTQFKILIFNSGTLQIKEE